MQIWLNSRKSHAPRIASQLIELLGIEMISTNTKVEDGLLGHLCCQVGPFSGTDSSGPWL